MDKELKMWVDEAMEMARRASDKNILVFFRNREYSDISVVVTNATTPESISAMDEASMDEASEGDPEE